MRHTGSQSMFPVCLTLCLLAYLVVLVTKRIVSHESVNVYRKPYVYPWTNRFRLEKVKVYRVFAHPQVIIPGTPLLQYPVNQVIPCPKLINQVVLSHHHPINQVLATPTVSFIIGTLRCALHLIQVPPHCIGALTLEISILIPPLGVALAPLSIPVSAFPLVAAHFVFVLEVGTSVCAMSAEESLTKHLKLCVYSMKSGGNTHPQ